MNIIEIGKYIRLKRIEMHLTQKNLADKLNISFQAVSKWETGTTLPDTSILIALSDVLEVSVDQILNSGEFRKPMNKKISIEEVQNALLSIPKLKEVLGPNNMFYNGMMNGLKDIVKGDFAEIVMDKVNGEILLAKSIIQLIRDGYYVTDEDIKNHFASQDIQEKLTLYKKKFKQA